MVDISTTIPTLSSQILHLLQAGWEQSLVHPLQAARRCLGILHEGPDERNDTEMLTS